MFSIKKLFQFLLFSRIVEDGGAAPDRGDVVTPPDVAAEQAAQAAADAEATAEAQAVKDAEELAAAEAATAEDKPRDQSGKFTKKEKDDNVMIPKSRFDAQLQKERDAREAAERVPRRGATLITARLRSAQPGACGIRARAGSRVPPTRRR